MYSSVSFSQLKRIQAPFFSCMAVYLCVHSDKRQTKKYLWLRRLRRPAIFGCQELKIVSECVGHYRQKIMLVSMRTSLEHCSLVVWSPSSSSSSSLSKVVSPESDCLPTVYLNCSMHPSSRRLPLWKESMWVGKNVDEGPVVLLTLGSGYDAGSSASTLLQTDTMWPH